MFSPAFNTSPRNRNEKPLIQSHLSEFLLPDVESIMLYCISYQAPNYYRSIYDRSVLPRALKNGNLKSCLEQLKTPATTCYLKIIGSLFKVLGGAKFVETACCFSACFPAHVRSIQLQGSPRFSNP